MVMARIVDYAPEARTYMLPPAHAACLTAGAPLGNMAVYSQLVGLVGRVQERLLRCFETGEGTSYDDYPSFHQIMAEDSAQTVTASLFDTIQTLAADLVARLDGGIDVLDAGCGRGSALRALAARFPKSRFVSYDLSPEATAAAQADADAAGLTNVSFEARDLTDYDERARFDLVTTFDAVHDPRPIRRRSSGACTTRCAPAAST